MRFINLKPLTRKSPTYLLPFLLVSATHPPTDTALLDLRTWVGTMTSHILFISRCLGTCTYTIWIGQLPAICKVR